MSEPERQIMSLLGEAVEHSSPEERAAFLNKACAGDAGRRARVEELLRAYQAAGNFLQGNRPPSEPVATIDEPISERPGAVIGPYKLLEQIGEGGFGVVFLAEQLEPVRRKVALKVLKPGMDSKQVIARFEAERQALALMDHPNIAKVFDGGATPSHRPFFVMELVKGIAVTEYCDQCCLTTRERLELFLSVCRAVQHAHQKGVIHRDLKPSNVLVAIQDGRPMIKVIDFGVAKAVNQRLSAHTLLTGFHQMIGTPLYMSPEQAEMSPLDVDTRADIYALGVLLYELLTGTTPFEKERLGKASFDELRRIIREEEPPRPSTRLSTLKDKLTTAAAQRRTQPRQLVRTVRGELDWIVVKCLEKDRNRRYETANSLARDVERYLADEPVLACPPSASYRVRKFVRRYRGPVWAGVLLLGALLGGIVATSWQAVRATRAEQLAGQRLGAEQAARRQAVANLRKARQAVDDSFTRISESTLLYHPNVEPLRKQLLQSAARYYEGFVREHGDDPELQAELVAAYFRIAGLIYALGTGEDWLVPFEKGIAVMEELMRRKPDVAALQSLQGGLFRFTPTYLPMPKPAEVLRVCERGRAVWEELVRAHPGVPGFNYVLSWFHFLPGEIRRRQGQYAEAARSLRRARDLCLDATAASPKVAHYRVGLVFYATILRQDVSQLGLAGEAAEADRQALAAVRKLVADFPDDPYYLELLGWTWDVLAHGREALGQLAKEEEAWREMLATVDKLARAFPTVPRYRNKVLHAQQRLGELLWGTGRRAEAAALYRQVADWFDRAKPEDAHGHDIRAWFLVSCPDRQFGNPHRAVELARRATTLDPMNGAFWESLGAAHYRAGSWQDAARALDKSKRLLSGGDAWAFFYLAMTHGKLGHRDEARRWYDQGVRWMEKGSTNRRELIRLRAEAVQVLGINDKK
jgi:serine/threonine protein kinase/tetratricopeptide (TPR) repeat protein